MIRFLKICLLFYVIEIFLISCSENDENPAIPQPEHLVAFQQQFTRSITQIRTLLTLAGIDSIDHYMNYDINLYTLTYRTRYLEQEVIASGVVTFPETTQPVPMLSFQNGTITSNREAPTENLAASGFISSVASAGYIFLIPDYIGFGNSKELLHPYYHAVSTSQSIRDMLLAAKELSGLEGYNFDGRIFLGGYSEGGYATMAAHKELEENPLDGFQLVASAPASGGYDLKRMQDYFFSLETYQEPYYLAFVAMCYAVTYDLPDILTDIFQEPYASRIPGLFDGDLSGDEIDRQLTNRIADLVQPGIRQHIDSDPQYKYILDLFGENSVHNWVPTIPMYMYHGTEDVTVPFQNSVETYQNMIRLGGTPEIIHFIQLEGATHAGGSTSYVIDMLTKFSTLK